MVDKNEASWRGERRPGTLTRLENVYLAMLRVIILVAATIALAVAIVGLVLTIPAIKRQLGNSAPAEISGAALGDFIRERNDAAIGATSEQEATDAVASSAYAVPADIKIAAANLVNYVVKRADGVGTDEDAQFVLMQVYGGMPPSHQPAYAASIRSLSEQLVASKGQPLNITRLNDLMSWHEARFKAGIAEQEAQRASDSAKAAIGLNVLGGAFAVFMAVVFCFLIVKIERNLRGLPGALAVPPREAGP